MLAADPIIDVAAVSSSMVGLLTAVIAYATFRASRSNGRQITDVHADVSQVHDEVKTVNGLPVGVLLERNEGRAIDATVAPEDMTSSQKNYVEIARGTTDPLAHLPAPQAVTSQKAKPEVP